MRVNFEQFIRIGHTGPLQLQSLSAFSELQCDFSLFDVLLVDGFQLSKRKSDRFLLLLTAEGHSSEHLLFCVQSNEAKLGFLLLVDLQVVSEDDALALH